MQGYLLIFESDLCQLSSFSESHNIIANASPDVGIVLLVYFYTGILDDVTDVIF